MNREIRLTGQFFANKDGYTEYRKGGKSEEFYEKHRAELRDLQTIYTNVIKMLGIEDERKTERAANKGIG